MVANSTTTRGRFLHEHFRPSTQGAIENVHCGVVVPIALESTHRTTMNTLGQFFRNARAAIRAILTCMARINFHQLRTSTFSLVAQLICENRPASVENALGEPRSCHSLDVQFFNGDQIMLIDQSPTLLMTKIFTSGGDAFVNHANTMNRPPPPLTSLDPPRKHALGVP